uniref:Uncharacterized protein n=1 Tax=Sphaerodactylus townsendi TaxID=933632 RepID=A0ACB8ECG7_9SAUR
MRVSVCVGIRCKYDATKQERNLPLLPNPPPFSCFDSVVIDVHQDMNSSLVKKEPWQGWGRELAVGKQWLTQLPSLSLFCCLAQPPFSRPQGATLSSVARQSSFGARSFLCHAVRG